MANNYCESSSRLPIPEDKMVRAEEIVDRIVRELEDGDEGYCGADITTELDGVWFCHDESINPEHVEVVAKALVEELGIDEPFICSWSYTCSKPRLGEFGGGAFAVQKGRDTVWIDAASEAQRIASLPPNSVLDRNDPPNTERKDQ